MGNIRPRWPFSCDADETLTPPFLHIDRGVPRGGRAGPACAGDATDPNCTARIRARSQLHSDATDTAARHRCAGRHDDRPARRAARRQTGEIRRRVVSARGCRSGNPRTDAGCRQHAGDSAARQPRRRSDRPAEIATLCNHLAEGAGLLDMALAGFLYAARSRLRYIKPKTMDAVAG